jgi:uncharacterized BrkB/YihY/UPF0761 family membrane protein
MTAADSAPPDDPAGIDQRHKTGAGRVPKVADPAGTIEGDAEVAVSGRLDRVRALHDRARRQLDGSYQHMVDRRSSVAAVDVAFMMYEEDRDAGGSLLSGAIAFRMFLWLLPAALLVVAGLGFESAGDPTAPDHTVRAAGITTIAADSINRAAQQAQPARWLALVLGLVFLYSTTVALVKCLAVTHALIWEVPVPRLQHKPRAVGEFLLIILVVVVGTSLASVIRNHSPGFGLVAMLAVVAIYAAGWWVLSIRLPHAGAAPVTALIPGAIVVSVGIQLMHLVLVYYLAARLTHASLWYGSLGSAAALLFGLYLGGRLIIAATVLNAALWARRHPGENRPRPAR